jgi:hypothetical protein
MPNKKDSVNRHNISLSKNESSLSLENNEFNNYLEEEQDFFKKLNAQLRQFQNRKDKLKLVKTYLEYLKAFKTQGVQGICGILKVNKSNSSLNKKKIVFKTSIDLDKTIEHEHMIITDLNKLRSYCPHFVGSLGMMNIPLSNTYVDDPKEGELFMSDNDYMPSNVLLLEYVSDMSFYHICKYSDKNVIVSQLIQILVSLIIAQRDCHLTHYDLHLDNILIKSCDYDTVFIYKINNTYIYNPTLGLYPVIIDMGSSYSQTIKGKTMFTRAENYENGLQPTMFDPLNDLHHLLLSTFYYLEPKSKLYNFLSTRVMHWFRYIPVLRKKGWKQLPHNIMENIVDRIDDECPLVNNYKVYREYYKEIINLINGLIILPWQPSSEEHSRSFEPKYSNNCLLNLIAELQKIFDIPSLMNDLDCMYVLREIVDLINIYREAYENGDPNVIIEFSHNVKQKILFLVSYNMKAIPINLNYEKMFDACLEISKRLCNNYYNDCIDHTEIINEAYTRTDMKNPFDYINFFQQNVTPRYTINNKTKIVLWDTDSKDKKFYSCDKLTVEQLNKIDNTSIQRKAEIILSMLN